MRLTLTCFVSLIFFSQTFAQVPVNDDCNGIIDLGEVPYCSMPAQYTNVDATPSVIDIPSLNIPACFNGGQVDRDVWFQFTVPADGSIIDVEISIFGNINGNGTLQLPQVAVYRGDCFFGGLAELDCASAPLGINELHLDLFNLTPGLPYYLRINDYSDTGSPNAGTFRLCVEKYVAEVNMGDVPGSQSCSGTLWDSGGPTGLYGNAENLSFSICPQEFHQCLILNVENYDIEDGWDFLHFFAGDDVSAPELVQLTGTGQDFEIQFSSDCATVQFTSDNSFNYDGFKITWTCSPVGCTVPPPTSCADPALVGTLPYQNLGLNTCFSGNSLASGPCDDVDFLSGNEYLFAYESPGDECIKITTSNTPTGAGIGVYTACPSLPGADCVSAVGGAFDDQNPILQSAFLENAGTYYIAFGAGSNCGTFDIQIDTVACPIVLPSASTCDKALNIGGCSNEVPEIIALNPGAGDPNFLVNGVNQGCFVNPQFNYSFFYFTAGEDGKFGFSVKAADPNEGSDIDYNVWGPIDNVDSICAYVSTHQPVRSSWADDPTGTDFTGLADVHPVLGTPVTDDFDCGSPATPGVGVNPDDFTRRLDVQQGKVYVVMLDDFGSAIESGGIAIDFGGTTDGVLEALDNPITVSADTVICPGQPVQLLATGGLSYSWSPDSTLTCAYCPNPLALPTQSTSYEVQIATTCQTVTKKVKVKIFDINLGPDVTVCNGAVFTLNPHPYDDVLYTWIGGPGLSCYNCPSPEVSGLTTGVYSYIALLTGPGCIALDTVQITVINGIAPQYEIADDQDICIGESVNLGGNTQAGTAYEWTSPSNGLFSTQANPSVTPSSTTTYYLSASSASCPVNTLDSVQIRVFQKPELNLQADTSICLGASVLLGFSPSVDSVTYAWTPPNSLDNPNIANPNATPTQTTTYQLTATNGACVETRTVKVTTTALSLQLSVDDSLVICQGKKVPIQAQVIPTSVPITWTPTAGLQINGPGTIVTAQPFETTLYTATATLGGCTRVREVYIAVDSLPKNLDILPTDTTICQGGMVTLVSPTYEPAEYPNIYFQWAPPAGQLTPDSLYNMVVQPDITTIYRRYSINGACRDTAIALVNVIPVTQIQVVPGDTSICPGETVQLVVLHPPGIQELKWTPPNNLSCADCDTTLATPAGTTTYQATATFQGCPTSAAATVNVLPPPGYQFPSDLNLCPGESIILNQVDDPNASYSWTSTDPAFVPTTAAQPTVTPALASTTYFLQATTTNGCTASASLTVNLAFATLAVSPDITICQNFSTVLNAQGSAPGTYEWSDGQTGQTVSVSPSETTTYTVTYTYGDGCQITKTVTVTVQGQGVSLLFPADRKICPGESVELNGLTVPGATYSWTSIPPGFTSSAAQPTVSPAQTTTYFVTATLGNCTLTDSLTITAYNAILSPVADTTVCPGRAVLIAAPSSIAGGSYFWMYNNTVGNPASFYDMPTMSTTYFLTYTYGDGCVLKEEINVTVPPVFSVDIKASPNQDTVNIGEIMTLSALITPSQNLSGFQYQWLENGTEIVGTNATLDLTFSTNDTAVYYRLVVTSPSGCTQAAVYKIIIILPEVTAPNAFTPDGDGVNDDFGLIVQKGKATVDRMKIYNRWGEKVFESTDPKARWNGRIDQSPAPSEVYVYVIEWRRNDGALQVLKGDVTLLR